MRGRSAGLALILALFVGLEAPRAQDAPPLEAGWYSAHFDDSRQCQWPVERTTVLYHRPQGPPSHVQARVGTTVMLLSWRVYTKPIVVEVRHALKYPVIPAREKALVTLDLQPGGQIYLLALEGEGYQSLWYKGRLYATDTTEMWESQAIDGSVTFRSCQTYTAECWWHIAPENRRLESQYWTELRLADGTTGWTWEVGNFGNIGCWD